MCIRDRSYAAGGSLGSLVACRALDPLGTGLALDSLEPLNPLNPLGPPDVPGGGILAAVIGHGPAQVAVFRHRRNVHLSRRALDSLGPLGSRVPLGTCLLYTAL